MIAKEIFATYAQYNEDIILCALLADTKKGFYVDVGANHEAYHSVTKLFYNRGWSGINLEPIPRLLAEFEKKRKRDINLQLAISNKRGKLTLREYPEHDGLSTLSKASIEDPDKVDLPHKDYTVQVDTLSAVLRRYKVGVIDFLKVDVEGYEREVLEGNDWRKYRPRVICIEANHRNDNWAQLLLDQRYTLAIFDGLNEYYVAEEASGILNHFAERATVLSHSGIRSHHLDAWNSDLERLSGEVNDLAVVVKKQDELIKSYQAGERVSLSNRRYLGRVKAALIGLTTDYLDFKRRSRHQ